MEPLLKCECLNCSVNLEFPAEGVGMQVECPKCHRMTRLFDPAEQANPAFAQPFVPLIEPYAARGALVACRCQECLIELDLPAGGDG